MEINETSHALDPEWGHNKRTKRIIQGAKLTHAIHICKKNKEKLVSKGNSPGERETQNENCRCHQVANKESSARKPLENMTGFCSKILRLT